MSTCPSIFYEPGVAERIRLLVDSFHRLLGRPLLDLAPDVIAAVWDAPIPVVAHDTAADPCFFFANRAALEVFDARLEQFIGMPSRFSAEAPERAERHALLERVTRDGFADDYRGIRVTAQGERFAIADGIVWNLIDDAGDVRGQAATFRPEAA